MKEKTSLFKKPAFQSFLSAFFAIVAGLLFGFLVMLISNPIAAFPGLATMMGGWLFNVTMMSRIGTWLYYVAPLILTGLSVGFAFKTGLFNIGATGQYTIGLFCSVFIGITCDFLGFFQWPVAILAGMLGGAFWGFLPGFLKAKFNVHEVISSIMFNYIGMYLINTLIETSPILYNSSQALTRAVDATAYTPVWGLRLIFPNSPIDIGILIAILAAFIIYVILEKTTFGYELKAVGLNRFASGYSGINEKKSIVLSMTISGALAGLGGALYILASGRFNTGTFYEPANMMMSAGFDGIGVALIAMSNPVGIIFSAAFVTFIQRGGYYMMDSFSIEIIDIIIATIIYASAFSLLVQDIISKRKKKIKLDKPATEKEQEGKK